MEETHSFIHIGKSNMTLYQAPNDAKIQELLKSYKLTLIVSILPSFDHSCMDIKKSCEKYGIRWFQIPLSASNEKTLMSSVSLLSSKIANLWKEINAKEEVFLVHCQYGIRRNYISVNRRCKSFPLHHLFVPSCLQ